MKTPAIFIKQDNRLLDKIDMEFLVKLQLEFAKEVINFDGHSTLSGNVVQVGFGSNSKELLEEVNSIFQKHGVNFDIYIE